MSRATIDVEFKRDAALNEGALGMLLIGHGTRDQQGLDEFLATARLIANRLPTVVVEPCFLELAQPTVADAIASLATRGVRHFVVSPLLLFAAGHAKQDIPQSVRDASASFPAISSVQAKPLARHPLVLQASAQRFYEAVSQVPGFCADQCALLMVGRGSSDESATAEMHRFTAERCEITPVLNSATCFVAMARPTFEEALVTLMEASPAFIVVQPHLLFHGELLTTVQRYVQIAENRYSTSPFSTVPWLVPRHLGVEPLIADAVIELFWQAFQMPASDR